MPLARKRPPPLATHLALAPFPIFLQCIPSPRLHPPCQDPDPNVQAVVYLHSFRNMGQTSVRKGEVKFSLYFWMNRTHTGKIHSRLWPEVNGRPRQQGPPEAQSQSVCSRMCNKCLHPTTATTVELMLFCGQHGPLCVQGRFSERLFMFAPLVLIGCIWPPVSCNTCNSSVTVAVLLRILCRTWLGALCVDQGGV